MKFGQTASTKKAIRETDPERLVTILSEAKARKVADAVRDAGRGGHESEEIQEKPVDPAEACRFLKEFSLVPTLVPNAQNKRCTVTYQENKLLSRKSPICGGV